MKQYIASLILSIFACFGFVYSYPVEAISTNRNETLFIAQASAPKTPTALSIDAVDYADQTIVVTFSWKSNEQAFRVYTRAQGETTITSLGYTQENPLQLSFAPESPFYYVSISAIKQIDGSIKESAKSEEILVSWDRPKPKTPINFSLDRQETQGTNQKAYISWSAVENAQFYKLYQTYNGETKALGSVAGTSTDITFPIHGQNIILQVSAANQFGESTKSQPLGIARTQPNTPTPTQSVIPQKVPDAPKNLRIVSQDTTDDKKLIEIQWDVAEYAQGYSVLAALSGMYQPISSVTTNRVIVNVPKNFGSFNIAIVAYNVHGTSDISNEVVVKSTAIPVTINSSQDSTTPTPSVTPIEEDVLSAVTIEEQSFTDNDVVLGPEEQPESSPSSTPVPESSSEEPDVHKPSVFSRIVAFFQSIWNTVFG